MITRKSSIEEITDVVFNHPVEEEMCLVALKRLMEILAESQSALKTLDEEPKNKSSFNQTRISAGLVDDVLAEESERNTRRHTISNQIAGCHYLMGYIFKKTNYPMYAKASFQEAINYFQPTDIDIIIAYRDLAEVCIILKEDVEIPLLKGREVACSMLPGGDNAETILLFIEWFDKQLESFDQVKYRRVPPAKVGPSITSKSEQAEREESTVNPITAAASSIDDTKQSLDQNTFAVKSPRKFFWALAPVVVAGVAVAVNTVLKKR